MEKEKNDSLVRDPNIHFALWRQYVNDFGIGIRYGGIIYLFKH